VELAVRAPPRGRLSHREALDALERAIDAWAVGNRLRVVASHVQAAAGEDGESSVSFGQATMTAAVTKVEGAVTRLYSRDVRASGIAELVEADIVLPQELAFGGGAASMYALDAILTHELGHLLGLAHPAPASGRSVMVPDPEAWPRTTPTARERAFAQESFLP
jgi:hypothetical protein